MSIQCAECECDDQTLTCQDPRSPPLELGIVLCPTCGEYAYRDRLQELYDEMEDELGTKLTNDLFDEVKR